MRILIIGGEKPSNDVTRIIFNYKSCNVEMLCVSSKKEALRILFEKQVDMVFVDVDLNGFADLEFVYWLKHEKKNIYIVIMSDSKEKAIESFKLKANGFLLKPINESDLIDELEYYSFNFCQKVK